MAMNQKDKEILSELAGRYAEIANLDVQKERIERYKKTVALEIVRPPVLIFEVPWGEIKDDSLVNVCSQEYRGIEGNIRRALYQWEHFQVDNVINPEYVVGKRSSSTGIGVQAHDTALEADTGTHISAHEYEDILATEEDLEKLQVPTITYNKEATEQCMEIAQEVFDGLMPVKLIGSPVQYNIWDVVSRLRGVDTILLDLVMRPEFMHETARKFMEIAIGMFSQMEELDLLGPDQLYLHATVAKTDELPGEDFDGKVRLKNIWGRCAAQIFGAVSPDMHDEFDLAYNEKIFGECGLLYYGCCEPMDNKIDLLRKRFKNLRKVSITPWADPFKAAENMGSDLVMAAKPNPANVGFGNFNPKTVEEEMTGYLEACKQNGTPCEFVLKDISTVGNKPENLTMWAEIANKVVDKYFG